MKIDKSFFDKEYFMDGTKSNYGPYQIADDCYERCVQIVEKYHPKRLLDVGCAMGFFVAQFRFLGVDAYGIDISNFAIETGKNLSFYAREEGGSENESSTLQKYLFEAGATSIPFPDKFFDLVVSWDTLEHIPEECVIKAIKEVERVGERQFHVIATKSEEWDKDKSHVTIKPISWWRDHFSSNPDLFGSSGEIV